MTSFLDHLLCDEAVASTVLDRDPYGGTYSLEESTVDNQTVGDTQMSEFETYETAEAAQTSNEASAAEARAWLQANADQLPEGVSVGGRGRLSVAARQAFENATGRSVK
jgi:hypothetical protein